jgi:hypothetical protein
MDKILEKLGMAQGFMYDSLNVKVTNMTLGEAYRIGSRVRQATKHIADTLDEIERIINANQ